jgi:hypothetical protein
MKHNKYPHDQTSKPGYLPASATPKVAAELKAKEMTIVPSPDEVARRAYFTYLNHGARDGHEVQHWLTAEAELIAERNLTRTHGFAIGPESFPQHLANHKNKILKDDENPQ